LSTTLGRGWGNLTRPDARRRKTKLVGVSELRIVSQKETKSKNKKYMYNLYGIDHEKSEMYAIVLFSNIPLKDENFKQFIFTLLNEGQWQPTKKKGWEYISGHEFTMFRKKML